MATNKFRVFGQNASVSNIFPTNNTDATSDYYKLFYGGIKPNELAKAQDVMTPLRELTIFSVGFFNWLASQYTPDVEFKDAEIGNTEAQTNTNLTAMLTLIQTALTTVITNNINAKEPVIEKNNSDKKGFLKYSGSAWTWDSSTYQAVNQLLTDLINQYQASGNLNNKGIMYKASGSTNAKFTDKPFVYFVSETQDANSNYVCNLATFDYPNN